MRRLALKSAPTQVETTVSILQELFSLWHSRATSYGDVLYSTALAKIDQTWRNVFTFFRPRHRCEQIPQAFKYDYHDFTISQGLISLQEAKDILIRVAETEQLSIPQLPAVRLLAFLYTGSSSRYYSRSDARNYPVNFPFFDYHFTVDQSCKALPPGSAVWVPTLPLYPSGRVAIEDLFRTRLGDDRAYEGVLTALVPDYRGKLSRIHLLNNGISVQVVCPPGGESALKAKLYFEDAHGSRVMKDLEFDDSRAAFVEANAFPRHLVVVLFSKKNGELIDERVFDAQLPFRPADLTIEEVEQTIENLIRGGESDTIEFKSQIPQRHEAIAATAVAFANQNGGKIFIGVENDGQIVGFSAPGAKDTVTNILRDRCEPVLRFETQEVLVLGKNIIVVTIFQGEDKPYQVKEKGFYLRMQGTNRLMTRYEWMRCIDRKTPIQSLALLRFRNTKTPRFRVHADHREDPASVNSRLICFRSSRQAAQRPM